MFCKTKVYGSIVLEVVASELIHSRKGSDDSKIEKIMSPPTCAKECLLSPTRPINQNFSLRKKIQHLYELLYFHHQLLCLGKLLFS